MRREKYLPTIHDKWIAHRRAQIWHLSEGGTGLNNWKQKPLKLILLSVLFLAGGSWCFNYFRLEIIVEFRPHLGSVKRIADMWIMEKGRGRNNHHRSHWIHGKGSRLSVAAALFLPPPLFFPVSNLDPFFTTQRDNKTNVDYWSPICCCCCSSFLNWKRIKPESYPHPLLLFFFCP